MSLNKNELLLKSSTRTGTDELEVSAEYTKCVDRVWIHFRDSLIARSKSWHKLIQGLEDTVFPSLQTPVDIWDTWSGR